MRLVFLTQEDPFYLPKIYQYLLPKLKEEGHEVVASVLFDVAPFGKKESKVKQLIDTYKVFGLGFTIHYTILYVKGLFSKDVESIMEINNIKTIKLPNKINHPLSLETIQNFNPDLLVSLAGNEIFRQPLIESAKYGIINLHSALLPKYRGLMPSFWVMRFNEEKTGVSVFFVDQGIDSGPIIVQKEVLLLKRTQAELIWELKYRGADAIIEACNLIAKHGKNTPTIDNAQKDMTYYSRPTRKDVQIFKSIGKKFF
jgi:methionyl-tRNA formyltransferase